MAKYLYQFQEERGEADLYVSDADGKTVWSVHYPSFYEDEDGDMQPDSTIFDDGFMRNNQDLNGLEKYLIQLGILSEGDTLTTNEDELDPAYTESGFVREYKMGGTVEERVREKMKESFDLPYQLAIYVPSTTEKNSIINKKEMSKRIDAVESFLSTAFGGFSAVNVEGGYQSSDKGLIQEDAVRIVAFAKPDNFEEKFDALIKQVQKWCKIWGQESMGIEFENDLFYVDANTKFELGGATEHQEPIEKFDLQSFLTYAYAPTRKLLLKYGLILRKDFHYSDGGTEYVNPEFMYDTEGAQANKLVVTYTDKQHNKLGDIIFDMNEQTITASFDNETKESTFDYEPEKFEAGGEVKAFQLVVGQVYEWTDGAEPLLVKYIGRSSAHPDIHAGLSRGKGYLFQFLYDNSYTELGMTTVPETIVEKDDDDQYPENEGKPLFSVVNVAEFCERLKAEVKAPFVSAKYSTLGGAENVSILMAISIDDPKNWPNGYIENSKYGRFSIERDGYIEQFSGSFGKDEKDKYIKFRKTKCKSKFEIIEKLNKFLKDKLKLQFEEGGIMPADHDDDFVTEFANLLQAKLTAYYKKATPKLMKPVTDVDYDQSIVKVVPGKKYDKINTGTSGKFMYDKEDGNLYFIKGYGTVDKKKNFGNLRKIIDADFDYDGYSIVPKGSGKRSAYGFAGAIVANASNKSGYTKEEYRSMRDRYDMLTERWADEEDEGKKEALGIEIKNLETEIHKYERDYK